MDGIDWEKIEDCDLERIEVPGGWLVRTGLYSDNGSTSICFYPDPNHLWSKENY